ncbi:MAG: pyridoxal-phosphate dependent enzyme [Phaeodactylibacter sp.]|nr:pyridoxal-phosphate dependent enzyme [Phaeodactylibacter sp.]
MNFSPANSAKTLPFEKPLNFKNVCLHCHTENTSRNYTCDCGEEGWREEYRALGLEYELDEEDIRRARQSFRDYDFDSPRGMLQYTLLPYAAGVREPPQLVGLTPLYRLRHLSGQYGCEVYIKNEGDNPSGCFKDRETMLCLLNARRKGLSHAVIYSSGNAAASAALFAQELKLHLLTFVAGDTYDEKIEFIRNRGADVIVIGDENTNFEEGYRLFSTLNNEGVYTDNGYDNWSVRNPYRVEGDKSTALETIKQLSGGSPPWVAPDYVIVPTANGSCLAGMWKGFQELSELGLIESLPAMVSVGIKNANPVYKAVQQEKTRRPAKGNIEKLDEADARIGSIIVAEEGYDSIQAAKAVLQSGGTAVEVQRPQIRKALSDFLEKEKELALEHSILPEPASYTALAAIEILQKDGYLKPKDQVVAVITGHGLKAREVTDELIGENAALQEVADQVVEQKREDMDPKASTKGRRVKVEASYDAVVEAFLRLAEEDVK